MRLVQSEDEREVRWEAERGRDAATSADARLLTVVEVIRRRSGKEIAAMFGCSEATVTNRKEWGRKNGYLDQRGNPTEKGMKLLGEHKEDGGEPVGI